VNRIHLFRFFVFVIFLGISDQFIGLLLKRLYSTTNYEDIAKIRYSCDSTNQQILIYGSSRAQHHYIPDTITKYTGLSCYNCGIGGQGLAFSYIQIAEMLKRQKPVLIILDVSPNIILDPESDEKLKMLMPFYYRDTIIQNILTNSSWIEKIKYYSAVYPYNGTILSIMKSILSLKSDRNKGYIPLYGRLSDESEWTDNSGNLIIPERQVILLNRIISSCKLNNVILKLVVSPIRKKHNSDDSILKQVRELAEQNGIEYLDFSIDKTFIMNNIFFKDNLHLNSDGATVFSIKLSDIILSDFTISDNSQLPTIYSKIK